MTTTVHQPQVPSHVLTFRLAALALGAASVATVAGSVTATNLFMQILALLPVLGLALLCNIHPGRAQGRQQVYYALVPVASGVVTATLVVGRAVFPGEITWFAMGAVASFVPFAVAAGLRSGPRRKR